MKQEKKNKHEISHWSVSANWLRNTGCIGLLQSNYWYPNECGKKNCISRLLTKWANFNKDNNFFSKYSTVQESNEENHVYNYGQTESSKLCLFHWFTPCHIFSNCIIRPLWFSMYRTSIWVLSFTNFFHTRRWSCTLKKIL